MAGLLACSFNIVVCIGIPLVVCLMLWRKTKMGLRALLFGMGGYVVAQLLLRQPGLMLLQNVDDYRVFAALHPTGYLFFLAVTAALFEECTRALIFRCFLKLPVNRTVPVCYGLGHGGLEAMTIGLNNIALLLVARSYLADAGWIIALAGFERISVMVAQVAFSMMVYMGKRGLFLAIVAHTLYDFLIVLLQAGWSQIALEGLLCVMSIALFGVAFKMQRRSAVK